MPNATNAIQVNNNHHHNMKPYIAIVFCKIEITRTNGHVPNEFLQQLNNFVDSHKSNGMCICCLPSG